MALSRPIGWLRDQRGDAVGLATADPLFQGGETKPTGYVATYSPVFTAEQVQQESKEASMALTPEQIDRLIQQADGLAPKEGSIFRALVKLTEAEVRKEYTELIQQLVGALESVDDAMPFPVARQALKVARARLEGKPCA